MSLHDEPREQITRYLSALDRARKRDIEYLSPEQLEKVDAFAQHLARVRNEILPLTGHAREAAVAFNFPKITDHTTEVLAVGNGEVSAIVAAELQDFLETLGVPYGPHDIDLSENGQGPSSRVA